MYLVISIEVIPLIDVPFRHTLVFADKGSSSPSCMHLAFSVVNPLMLQALYTSLRARTSQNWKWEGAGRIYEENMWKTRRNWKKLEAAREWRVLEGASRSWKELWEVTKLKKMGP